MLTGNRYTIAFILLFLVIPLKHFSQEDSSVFGKKDRISNSLIGKIYFLPEGISKLPDFDTMSSVGTIYTQTINIPGRSWVSGFPGISERFEWFAIEYKGHFKVDKAGEYQFRLVSDDGARLIIDDDTIIDNDGLHAESSKNGKTSLREGVHNIILQYFQGPRTSIALQLFASVAGEAEDLFPGKNFQLTDAPKTPFSLWWFLLLLLLIPLWFVVRKKRKDLKT